MSLPPVATTTKDIIRPLFLFRFKNFVALFPFSSTLLVYNSFDGSNLLYQFLTGSENEGKNRENRNGISKR